MKQEYTSLLPTVQNKNKDAITTLRQVVDMMIKQNVPVEFYKDYFNAISAMNNAALQLENKIKKKMLDEKFGTNIF